MCISHHFPYLTVAFPTSLCYPNYTIDYQNTQEEREKYMDNCKFDLFDIINRLNDKGIVILWRFAKLLYSKRKYRK